MQLIMLQNLKRKKTLTTRERKYETFPTLVGALGVG